MTANSQHMTQMDVDNDGTVPRSSRRSPAVALGASTGQPKIWPGSPCVTMLYCLRCKRLVNESTTHDRMVATSTRGLCSAYVCLRQFNKNGQTPLETTAVWNAESSIYSVT